MLLLEVGGEVGGLNANGVAHAHVRKLATVAQSVDGGSRQPEAVGDLAHRQQVVGTTVVDGKTLWRIWGMIVSKTC